LISQKDTEILTEPQTHAGILTERHLSRESKPYLTGMLGQKKLPLREMNLFFPCPL